MLWKIRTLSLGLLLLAAGVLWVAAVHASATNDSAPRSTGTGNDGGTERLREGTQLTDRTGSFEPAGDRYVFRPDDGGPSLLVLENLALQRVARLLQDNSTARWSISGQVTEYHSGNYLLLQRVILKSER